MAKGLGNNPLGSDDSPLRPTAAPEPKAQPQPAKLVPKSVQIDSLLNERLRRCAYESRKKEAQILRDALHQYLSKEGY
jgi:hypothetical protein